MMRNRRHSPEATGVATGIALSMLQLGLDRLTIDEKTAVSIDDYDLAVEEGPTGGYRFWLTKTKKEGDTDA